MKKFTTIWMSRVRLIKLLQSASALLVSGLLVVLLLEALVPASLALVLGEIVSRVNGSNKNILSTILLPLILFAVVMLVSQLVGSREIPLALSYGDESAVAAATITASNS